MPKTITPPPVAPIKRGPGRPPKALAAPVAAAPVKKIAAPIKKAAPAPVQQVEEESGENKAQINFQLPVELYQEARRVAAETGEAKSLAALTRMFLQAIAECETGEEERHEAVKVFLAMPRPEGSRAPNGYGTLTQAAAAAEEAAQEEQDSGEIEEVQEEEEVAPAPAPKPVKKLVAPVRAPVTAPVKKVAAPVAAPVKKLAAPVAAAPKAPVKKYVFTKPAARPPV